MVNTKLRKKLTGEGKCGRLTANTNRKAMTTIEKRKKRLKEIEAIYKVYNGSAIIYHTPQPSSKSISQICSRGAKLAPGTTVSSLLDEVRK